jgi:hypothetical protein
MRTLQPAPNDKPYALLEALVDALIARGARSERPDEDGCPFAPSPEGFIAVLDQPIDWPWITANYELPVAVRYDEQRDVLLDDEHWTAVYGSSGTRALQ